MTGCSDPLAVPSRAAPRTNAAPFAASTFRVETALLADPEPRLAAAWDALARDAAEPNPFAERWFVGAACHLPGAADVRLLQVWSGDRLAALLPIEMPARYGRLPVHHIANWLHHHCFLGTPLIRRGDERAAWDAILPALDREPGALAHLAGLVEDGPVHRALVAAARGLGRSADTVYRIERALLDSDLSPAAYYEATVRKKKRKEIDRLRRRLADEGAVGFSRLAGDADPAAWIAEFLALERAGWKGANGSALADAPATARFFAEAVTGAQAAGRLDFLRLDLDGRAIAMLVNFMAPPGGFSFKIAFDEGWARFSPGVLIELENLAVLARGDIAWMDSCAVEDHPMIDRLWTARRPIIRVTLPLSGARRAAIFHACRTAERASAAWRARRERAA